jgi:hypothetical protein
MTHDALSAVIHMTVHTKPTIPLEGFLDRPLSRDP